MTNACTKFFGAMLHPRVGHGASGMSGWALTKCGQGAVRRAVVRSIHSFG